MRKIGIRDVVVVIPGIAGSILVRDNKEIWGPSLPWSSLLRSSMIGETIRLEQDDPFQTQLSDGVVATGLMPSATIVPGFWKTEGYSALRHLMLNRFDLIATSSHNPRFPANYIEFAYDWRRDIRSAAQRLNTLVERALSEWRQYTGLKDAKVVMIAHSMGGLVTKYYLEVLGGWKYCKAWFAIGTPFSGSVQALEYLANGYKAAFIDLSASIRTFSSVYQLLPTERVCNVMGTYRRVSEVTSVSVLQSERMTPAMELHQELARRDQERRDPADRPSCLPVVGVGQPTFESATVVRSQIKCSSETPAWMDPTMAGGDGTVPRFSATASRGARVLSGCFVTEKHASLLSNSQVLTQIFEQTRQLQLSNIAPILGGDSQQGRISKTGLSLSVEDVYLPEEPFEIRVRAVDGSNVLRVTGRLARVYERGDEIPLGFQQTGREWVSTTARPNRGFYRVIVEAAVRGTERTFTVADVFVVG